MAGLQPELRAIFCEALARPTPQDQAHYLDQACGGRPELRARVVALLRAHEQAGGFLEEPAAETAVAEEPATQLSGMLIGPYKLLEQIGEGGFGMVFMAQQQGPVRRQVAVKVLKPGMDTRQVVARFEAERQALALMNHPNIAQVFDAGETPSGRPYFVMELVKGVSITAFCDQHQLGVRERLGLFASVCQAVQHAHHKAIIHRDLKPSNVLVTLHDGVPVVKVIDFGIAKAVGQQLTDKTLFTNFAQLVGTPLYMSPEQAELSGLDVDTRSDIYTLGVLLYELLTGTTPLDEGRLRAAGYDEFRRLIRQEQPPKPSTRVSTLGQAAATVSARRQSDPGRLRQLFRGELDWIVMKALEKDRNRRYETASAFAADVQRYLHDEPVLACPPSALYRFGKFARRNRLALATGAVVAAAVLVTLVSLAWSNLLVKRESAQKEGALQDKDTAVVAARESAREATDQLFLALLNQARAGRFSRQMGQRLDSLDALEKAARIHPDERLRDEAMAAMALPDVRRGPGLHAYPAGTLGVAYDGRYQTYARIDDQGIVSIRSLPDNEEIGCIKTKSTSGFIRLSPNGQFLAVLDHDHALQLWRVAHDKPLLGEALRPCGNLAFSPDSRQLAVANDDSVVCLDLASGQETTRWRLPARAHGLAFHPDNRRLAVGYANNQVASIYDSAQGNLVADLPVGSMNLQNVAWHPDGTRLAVAGTDPRIQIWDVAAKRKLATLEGHVEPVWALTFHPAGGLLGSIGTEGVLLLWDPATGRQLMQLPPISIPRFSSTGQYLGYTWQGGERMQSLEVTTSREYRTIVSSLGAGQGAYRDGAISPDGRLLALGMGSGGDRLWDLSSGRELAVLPSGSSCVLFQPDGRELLTCGDTGLHRWPIQDRQEAANELRLGPPTQISLPFVPQRAARSLDGRTLAVVSETSGTGLLLDLATPSSPPWQGGDPGGVGQLFAHLKAGFVALSPDGRWIASSGWHSDRVRLWNAQTGKMAHEWALGGMMRVFFTPDSRALIICRSDAFTFWDVETLQPIRRLDKEVPLYPGYVAFSPDGKLMALEMAPAVIHLKEVATGRTVAKLEDPHGDRAGWMGFTPDGTQLVVVAPYAKAIHIWDLRAMRERLKRMGLDWHWPEFPPADPKGAAELAKVEVLPGDLVQPDRTREQKARQAIEQYRLEVTTDPDNPKACNELAWTYLTAPAALRDVKAALPLAEKAVRLAAGNANYRNTLAVAYYRAGRYREAVDMLRPNLEKQDDRGLACDLYFLAMSHHRLGETARARDYLAWAVRWTTAQCGLRAAAVEELNWFRAEAEEVLGTKNGP